MDDDWDEDLILLERWRRDDPLAPELLFARHGHAVIHFFRNKVRLALIEDFVQETWLRFLARRDNITNGRAIRAYLIGTARNVLLEHIRKREREHHFDPEYDAITDAEPGPSSIAAKRNEVRLLLAALRRLPLNDQILLERRYFEGIRGTELAVEEGVTSSAMRSRLLKARTKLQVALGEIESSGPLLQSTIEGLDNWLDGIRALLHSRCDDDKDDLHDHNDHNADKPTTSPPPRR